MARRRTLSLLAEAQRGIEAALSSLLDSTVPPEVSACVVELHYAATWFSGELEKRTPRGRRRAREEAVARLGVSVERLLAVPGLVDRLRLVNRGQRWMVTQIEMLLAQDLDPDIRELLREGRDVHVRGVQRCDEIIAMLDRGRELSSGPE